MITNADAMASFNQAAQLVSDEFALQLPEAMGYLSKVSAATGEDVGFMLDSMVKGVGRLSPMILDNLGIQVNLTEANEAYAAQLGISASELTKSQQQTALMNQVMEKLSQNTAAMPEVTGTAAAAWGSFQTTLTDTKDTIGLALLPVVTPLLQAFSDLAAKILPPLATFITEKLIPAITSLVNWFKAEIAPRLQETGKILRETLQPAFKELWTALQNVIGALGMGSSKIDVLDVAVAAISVGLKAFVIVVKGVATFVHGLADAFNAVASAIKYVINKFEEMKQTAADVANSLPSWLIPGSPTPFELGLRGIAKELGNVNSAFGGVSLGGGGFAGAGAGGGGMMAITVNLTYAPAVSLGDRYEAESRLAPLIAGAVRQELESRGAI